MESALRARMQTALRSDVPKALNAYLADVPEQARAAYSAAPTAAHTAASTTAHADGHLATPTATLTALPLSPTLPLSLPLNAHLADVSQQEHAACTAAQKRADAAALGQVILRASATAWASCPAR